LSGGAKSGGLHIILAPPGVGKSWFLVNIAANALKLNKKVLFVTL
jgi:KaiC/GvpD/RAD55 family RecA-like ATPase